MGGGVHAFMGVFLVGSQHKSQNAWLQIPALPLADSVILSKFLHFSLPCFSHLGNVAKTSDHLEGVVSRIGSQNSTWHTVGVL